MSYYKQYSYSWAPVKDDFFRYVDQNECPIEIQSLCPKTLPSQPWRIPVSRIVSDSLPNLPPGSDIVPDETRIVLTSCASTSHRSPLSRRAFSYILLISLSLPLLHCDTLHHTLPLPLGISGADICTRIPSLTGLRVRGRNVQRIGRLSKLCSPGRACQLNMRRSRTTVALAG